MILICPKCKTELTQIDNSLRCENNHSFDISRDGYVNLLMSQKSGDKIGDSRASAHARHSFLSKGYYECLKRAIGERMSGTVLGVPQTLSYFDKMQDRIINFVSKNSRIKPERFRDLMMNTGELTMDMGTVIDGETAVKEGLIDSLGGLSDAIEALYELIETGEKRYPDNDTEAV